MWCGYRNASEGALPIGQEALDAVQPNCQPVKGLAEAPLRTIGITPGNATTKLRKNSGLRQPSAAPIY